MTPRSRQQPQPEPEPAWAGSVEEWQRRAGPHEVTLASGQPVTFRLMRLERLLLEEALPDDLREIVALHFLNKSRGGLDAVIASETMAAGTDPDAQARLESRLRDAWALTLRMVAAGLVAPKPTLEQIEDGSLPDGDLEELAELITGRRAFDSRGVRIGVEELSVLATFRHGHDCPEGCSGCEQALRDLSSVHLG